MSQVTSPSSGQPYGLARVCRVWGEHAPPSTGSGTSTRHLAPAEGHWGLGQMTNWWTISGASWRRRLSPAKATVRCGPGCGMAVSVRRRVGSCA